MIGEKRRFLVFLIVFALSSLRLCAASNAPLLDLLYALNVIRDASEDLLELNTKKLSCRNATLVLQILPEYEVEIPHFVFSKNKIYIDQHALIFICS